MGFSSPSASSRKILSYSNTATSGTANTTFTIPQDVNSIVVKFWTATNFTPQSTNAAQVYIQTSEDGGTTWRDVAAWTTQAAIPVANAHFQPIACLSGFSRGIANWVGSVQTSTLALAATASVATGITSGLPMMGTLGRVFINYTGTLTTGGVNVDIFAPQSSFAS